MVRLRYALGDGHIRRREPNGVANPRFLQRSPSTLGRHTSPPTQPHPGCYAADSWSFAYRDTPTAPVRALRSSPATGNGVYGSPGSFPSSSYLGTNYYVDVTLSLTSNTPPAVKSTSPANNVTGVSTTAPITVTFTTPISGADATFVLTGPDGAVAGNASLDSTSKILTSLYPRLPSRLAPPSPPL